MSESTDQPSDPKIIYDYPPPVSELLTLGDAWGALNDWPNYLDLGLTSDHIPDLIRMVLDEDLHWAMSDTLEVWAPIHAWRVLGQLRAEAAAEPLVGLFSRVDEYGDDWVNEELPVVFGQIGQAAIDPLKHFLADDAQREWARVAAASSFEEISKQHPELRDQCVAVLTEQLAQYQTQPPTLNGFIILYLTELKAIESISVMKEAFAANCVDLMVQGDWEDTQIRLGLLEERLTPKPSNPLFSQLFKPLLKEKPRSDQKPRHSDKLENKANIKTELKAARKAKAKLKAKRKQQRQARKKQRKRK